MSDILSEGAPNGALPEPAPKKTTRRKPADPSAAPKPRKTPVRKKSEEAVTDSPVESRKVVASSESSQDAAPVVRKKRVVKKAVAADLASEQSAPEAVKQAPQPAPASPASPVVQGEQSAQAAPSEERRKVNVRRVSMRRKPQGDDASQGSQPSQDAEYSPRSQAPAETREPMIRVVHEDVVDGGRQDQGSSSQDYSQGEGRRFQKRQKFQKNFNRQNGRNDNGRNGGRNENFKQRRENSRDARSSGQDNNAPRQAAPVELGPPEEVDGLLELTPKGFGFLRTQKDGFEQSRDAVYVSNDMVRQFGLRHAVWIRGTARRHARGIQLTEISDINGFSPEAAHNFPHFDELKAVNPNKRIAFETTPDRYTTRTLDLVAPVGRGQRGLIVSPPRAGKTTFLQHIAEAVAENHADSLHLMILLIDERPEEVTEFKRTIKGAEVYASSNDGKVKDHCRLAELCIERAKRLVEAGKHVFLLVDSITRLSRAYNNADRGSGRTMSGGIDARALEMPRRLFAAARNTRNAGSLTILATALVETNSRMDDLIFQEFKGTGNMELVLNRRIAEQYIYPAVDILKSGTRREELILPEAWLSKIHLIRRALAGHKPVEAMERFLFFLRKYPSNVQMLLDLKQRV